MLCVQKRVGQSHWMDICVRNYLCAVVQCVRRYQVHPITSSIVRAYMRFCPGPGPEFWTRSCEVLSIYRSGDKGHHSGCKTYP